MVMNKNTAFCVKCLREGTTTICSVCTDPTEVAQIPSKFLAVSTQHIDEETYKEKLEKQRSMELKPRSIPELPNQLAAKVPTKNDGSTASYYELPLGAKELQDIISYLTLNAQLGEILRATYRYGRCPHSSKVRDLKKIIFYANAELTRLELYEQQIKLSNSASQTLYQD